MNLTLEQFKKRNRKRNAPLYLNQAVAGYDYITCPVSGERLSMIKTSYIERVLKMNVSDYDKLYPGVRGVSESRKKNIKTGLQTVDVVTGKTKYQISQEKTRVVLSKLDQDGVSGYKRKGQKTRETHMNNIDSNGLTGYQRQAQYRTTTVLENGLTIEQNAHIKQRNTLLLNGVTRQVGASKLSKKVLYPIIQLLNELNIKFYFDKHEYCILDPQTKSTYFYDLTIPELSMTIEYQSKAWHTDPSMTDFEWVSWKPPKGKIKTAEEVLNYDYNKARVLFRERNYATYYVWQRTEDADIRDLLCLLKTLTMKY